MNSFLGRVLILTVVVLLCFWGFINTDFLATVMAPRFLETYFPVEVKSFAVSKQSFSLPKTLQWDSVRMVLAISGREYTVFARSVTLPDVLEFAGDRSAINIFMDGVDVKSEQFSLQDFSARASLNLSPVSFVRGEAIMKGREARFDRFRFESVAAALQSDTKQLQIDDIKFSGYAGQGQGQLRIEYEPMSPYILWLEFDPSQYLP